MITPVAGLYCGPVTPDVIPSSYNFCTYQNCVELVWETSEKYGVLLGFALVMKPCGSFHRAIDQAFTINAAISSRAMGSSGQNCTPPFRAEQPTVIPN